MRDDDRVEVPRWRLGRNTGAEPREIPALGRQRDRLDEQVV
jgi:hypothetical protein